MTTPLSKFDIDLPLPSSRQVLSGLINRLLLPIVAVVLVAWNLLFFLNNCVLMPANDFGRIHYSAQAFVEGRDMYAWNKAVPAKIEKDYAIDLYNMNPPHLHLIFLPFTLLADDQALMVWWSLSGLCLFLCLRWIFAESAFELTAERRRWGLLLLLALAPTAAMLATAQLSFVLLVPITLMWLAARRGLWGWSGFFFGLALSVKPFLGVVLAYFVWRRHWRAAATTLLTVLLCFAVGLAVFGWDNHLSWRNRLAVSDGWAWLPMNASLMGMMTRTLSASVWYVPLVDLPVATIWVMWLMLGGILGIVALAVTSRGKSADEVDRNLAITLLTSLLLCPLGWIYYLWLAVPALLGLWMRGWPRGTEERAQAARLRWSRRLSWVTGIAFLWPIILTRIFQPDAVYLRFPELAAVSPWSALATLSIGNIYFWGLLALWLCLVWDARQHRAEASGVTELAYLSPEEYRISVVMPVFSETDTVRQITTWLIHELGGRLEEIIIVQSPRSSEASRAICRDLAAEFPQVRLQTQRHNPGLGNAVREGYAAVNGNLVLNIDSDGEMEIETVLRLLDKMADGNHELVVASRWLRGGGFEGYSGLKFYLNWCFQQVFRCLFWTRLHDLTYGFKLVRAELVRGIRWEGTLHEVACETTLKPVRLGVSVAEVPSKWTARTQGVSKNTFWRNFRYVHMAVKVLVKGVPFPDQDATPGDHEPHTQPAETTSRPTLVRAVPEVAGELCSVSS